MKEVGQRRGRTHRADGETGAGPNAQIAAQAAIFRRNHQPEQAGFAQGFDIFQGEEAVLIHGRGTGF